MTVLKMITGIFTDAYERFISLNKETSEDTENSSGLRNRSESCATSKQIFQMFIEFEGGMTLFGKSSAH